MTAPLAGKFPGIVCTLGKTTDAPAVLEAMRDAGMGMARVNTAYGPLSEIEERIELAHAAGVPVMLDLKGPQVRIECTTERTDPVTGEVRVVPCRYPVARGEVIQVGFGEGPVRFNHDFAADVEPGDTISFENGAIVTRVIDPAERGFARPRAGVLLEVLDPGPGRLSPFTGASVPGKRLSVPHLSGRDERAIALGARRKVACYALSFARDAGDILHLDRALASAGAGEAAIVPKIEEPCGIRELEGIVSAARGAGRDVAVMIGRGDLFVELPRKKLFGVEADLIRRCRALGVPAIVATGLLLSMQEAASPARSEVCDVAWAVREGAASFLLSDETSNGKNPALAVRALAEIVEEYRGVG